MIYVILIYNPTPKLVFTTHDGSTKTKITDFVNSAKRFKFDVSCVTNNEVPRVAYNKYGHGAAAKRKGNRVLFKKF